MRLTILHDRAGNILKVAAYPADHPPVQFETADGHSIVHVDQHDLRGADRSEVGRRLAELHTQFRVTADGKLERLTPAL